MDEEMIAANAREGGDVGGSRKRGREEMDNDDDGNGHGGAHSSSVNALAASGSLSSSRDTHQQGDHRQQRHRGNFRGRRNSYHNNNQRRGRPNRRHQQPRLPRDEIKCSLVLMKPTVEEMRRISSALARDVSSAEGSTYITALMARAVVEAPEKTAVYAGLLAFVSSKVQSTLAANVADRCMRLLPSYVREGNALCGKLILRFLSELVFLGLATIESLWKTYDAVLLHGTSTAVRAAAAAYPWACSSFRNSDAEREKAMRESIDAAVARLVSDASARSGHIAHFENAAPSRTIVESRWVDAKLFADAEDDDGIWSLRPYRNPEELGCTLPEPFDLGELETIGEAANATDVEQLRKAELDIFAASPKDSDARKSLDKFTEVQAAAVRQRVSDILLLHSNVGREAAELINGMKTPHPNEHITVGTVLGSMLALPAPAQNVAFYMIVLCNMCKLKPKAVAIAIEDAVDALVDRASELHPDIMDRVADWFSYHISTFGMKWPWKKWEALIADDGPGKESAKLRFLSIVFYRMESLSYFARISKAVPETFCARFLRPRALVSKYFENGESVGQAMLSVLKEKKGGEYTSEKLAELTQGWSSNEKVALLVHACIKFGFATFSHAAKAMSLCKDALTISCDAEDMQLALLDAAFSGLEFSKQWFAHFVEQLILQSIVHPFVLGKWCAERCRKKTQEWFFWRIIKRTASVLARLTLKDAVGDDAQASFLSAVATAVEGDAFLQRRSVYLNAISFSR